MHQPLANSLEVLGFKKELVFRSSEPKFVRSYMQTQKDGEDYEIL